MLHRPIESIISQTFPSWELIIVDDGSTDDTRQLVKSYRDNRIRYFYQQNQERSATRNHGIAQAHGKYICFLDSDDYYLPNHLESFYKKIIEQKSPVAVFYCNTIEDRDGELIKFLPPEIKAANPVEWVVQASLGSPRTCVHHSIFVKHQFNPKINVGEDVDLWVRVFKEYPVIYIDAATVAFVTHVGRTVNSEEAYIAHLKNLECILKNDSENWISKKVRRRILSNAWLRLGVAYKEQGKKTQAIRTLLWSLIKFPEHRGKEKLYLLSIQIPLLRLLFKK